MTDKVITKDKVTRELMELRWRINKLEEMKNCGGWVKQRRGTEEESANQSQSSQFFLAMKSSPLIQKKDDFRNEGNLCRRKDINSRERN
jgi:hypothetical protein